MIDSRTAFGVLAVTAMLVTYALEERSRWCVLGFAGACVLGAIYGFLQGAWPFGVLEAIWSLVAMNRWRQRSRLEAHAAAESTASRTPPRTLS